MKIKYLFLAMAMTVATSASAQFVSNGGKSSGSFSSSSTELDPKSHFVAEFRIGSIESSGGFGINLGGTKELTSFGGFTLAWDFVNVEWTAPFSSPADLDFLSAKTGLRLFSPSFANDKVRLYTNLSMGYTCVLSKGIGGLSKLSEFKNAYTEMLKSGYVSESRFEKLMEQFGYDTEDEDKWEYLEDYVRGKVDDDEMPSTKMQANHGFGLTFGVGVQIAKKVNIGYSLQYETAFKSKNHFATIGYTF